MEKMQAKTWQKIWRQRKRFIIPMTLMLAVAFMWRTESIAQVGGSKIIGQNRERACVVIDAGHGGFDPGKVGINGASEKDVNLRIALWVKTFLEQEDVEVILTRGSDAGLYEENSSNKKVQDMKKRISIIEETRPDVTVSIHQNSYPEEYVHGAQVFYYTGSGEGKALADLLQESLVSRLDAQNHRVAKGNDSYYLLKKTSSPIVIVEYCVSDRLTGL